MLFRTVDQAVGEIPAWIETATKGFLLTRDVQTMRRLAEAGALADVEVNLGGLHDAPGRRQVLPYLFLTEDDRRDLEFLETSGVRVTARDVPTARKIEVDEILQLGSD